MWPCREALVTHYQIAIITNDAADESETLKKTIQRRMAELGCDSGFVQFLDERTASSRDKKAPTVAAYISLKEHPPRSLAIVELLSVGVLVVPVVADLHRYTSFVFTELEPINGLEVTTNDPEFERVAGVLPAA